MQRNRFVIQKPHKHCFQACAVVEWLPVYTRADAVQILLNNR